MKLIGDKTKSSVRKVLLAAEYVGVPVSVAPVQGGCGCEKKARCALNSYPVLETPQGTLKGSNTCAKYFARLRPDKGVYGQTHHQASEVDQWLDFCLDEIECCLACPNSSSCDAKKCIQDAFKTIDAHLCSHTYLVGENITLADLALISIVAGVLTPECVSGLCHLERWFNTIANQKPVKKVLGDVKIAAPAASKPAAAPAPEDPEQPPKPARCPLDDLPPSPFVLDAWKRAYSNTKDLYGEAMKYFWEHYDPKGWSLWYMKYDKLEDECTVSYVTSNQLGGFLQRTDPNFRKYAFGNCNVIGKDKDFNITGVWLFRGTEMPPQMKEHPSYEYHTWRKLDHTNEADKKLIADYWCADEEVEGTPVVDSKVYK